MDELTKSYHNANYGGSNSVDQRDFLCGLKLACADGDEVYIHPIVGRALSEFCKRAQHWYDAQQSLASTQPADQTSTSEVTENTSECKKNTGSGGTRVIQVDYKGETIRWLLKWVYVSQDEPYEAAGGLVELYKRDHRVRDIEAMIDIVNAIDYLITPYNGMQLHLAALTMPTDDYNALIDKFIDGCGTTVCKSILAAFVNHVHRTGGISSADDKKPVHKSTVGSERILRIYTRMTSTQYKYLLAKWKAERESQAKKAIKPSALASVTISLGNYRELKLMAMWAITHIDAVDGVFQHTLDGFLDAPGGATNHARKYAKALCTAVSIVGQESNRTEYQERCIIAINCLCRVMSMHGKQLVCYTGANPVNLIDPLMGAIVAAKGQPHYTRFIGDLMDKLGSIG